MDKVASRLKNGRFCLFIILCLAASLSLATSTDVWSTTIVGLWTPEQIVIAADSLSRKGGELGSVTRPSCKIIQVSNMFYALSGLDEDPETGFAAHDAVVEAAQSPGRLIDKMNIFQEKVLPGLRRAIANIRAKYPANYQKDFAGKPGIEIKGK